VEGGTARALRNVTAVLRCVRSERRKRKPSLMLRTCSSNITDLMCSRAMKAQELHLMADARDGGFALAQVPLKDMRYPVNVQELVMCLLAYRPRAEGDHDVAESLPSSAGA